MSASRVACLRVDGEAVSESRFLALAEACQRFSPKIAVRAERAVFLDLTGMRELAPERALSARLPALARRLGFARARVAFAEDAATAWVFASAGGVLPAAFADVPLEALIEYASPFESDPERKKEMARLVERLRALGLAQVGEFMRLPAPSIAPRFGARVLGLHARLHGRLPLVWPVLRLPERIGEDAQFDVTGPCDSLESLWFPLRALVDRAMARLRGRGERASGVRIILRMEKRRLTEARDERELAIALPVPQGGTSGLFPILRDQLFYAVATAPLLAPVIALRFEVSESVPGRGSQKDFFQKKEEQAEAFAAIAGRLALGLGPKRVFQAVSVARHLPEGAWVPVLTEPFSEAESVPQKNPVEKNPARPARLLRRPRPLRWEAQGAVLLDSRGSRRWRVLRWEGPERLSGEWWKSTVFERDYYRVCTVEGAELWIFRDLREERAQSGGFYLHGYFD